ncbi:HAMP domain-containing histidine kinase [Arthrobacter sp. Sa2BUA2]|uniref:histidine kinase n=1 Tax=Arthrobacter pullicola TaxID=2762224 RepID=A0ABR8YEY9_9MICC|nr:HAMP domain-containing sensor histidine kinase [Arthrobacter pullicola]MBD8042686.1 HAMP domain-containing histidine kinase [Arthrobacter pullicola]
MSGSGGSPGQGQGPGQAVPRAAAGSHSAPGSQPGQPRWQRWLEGWRLRSKLLAATLALLLLTCLTIGFFSHAVMNVYLTRQLDQTLIGASDRAVGFQFPHGRFPDPDRDPLDAPGQGRIGMLGARVTDGAVVGAAVVQPDGSRAPLLESDLDIIAAVPPVREPVTRTLSVGEYRLVAQPQAGTIGTVVVSGLPLAEKNNTLFSLGLTIAGVSAVGLAVTGVLSYLIIRRALRPLEKVSALATQVATMPLESGDVDLPERVPEELTHPATEVGSVGLAVNRMLDNVSHALAVRQRSETQVRQFVADASHELRTPLTSIRGYTEMVRLTEDLSANGQQSLGRVEAESRRMTGLVEDLLLLARLDEGRGEVREEVDLTQLVIESVSDARVAAQDHNWTISLPEEPVIVQGDPGQLRQVLINLLTNGSRHTDPGTTISTRLAPADGGGAVITVADNGPGIPAPFQEHIFSRFTRADAARSGRAASSGLGLAIVAAIVSAHQGSIHLESEPGRTVFTVRLPAGNVPNRGPSSPPQ